MAVKSVLFGILFCILFCILSCIAHLAPAQTPVLLDAMTDAQTTAAGAANAVSGNYIIGGEREISNLDNFLPVVIADGLFSGSTTALASVRMVYDGQDGDVNTIDYTGLGGIDLSEKDMLRISDIEVPVASATINIAVFSDGVNASGVLRGVITQPGSPPDLLIPFSDFVALSGDGVDWSRVGAIVIAFTGRLLMKEITFEIEYIPVELSAFDALVDGRNVHLTWQTESEHNNAGFEVQHARAIDGPYKKIAYIPGNGTTLEPQTYVHTMAEAGAGVHFFQLKQIDFDGTVAFHKTAAVHVEADAAYTLGDAYPNPFNPQTSFQLTVSAGQQVKIDVYDLLGRVQKRVFDGYLEAGQLYTFEIDGSQLSNGTYLYRVQGEQFNETKRIVLAK